MLFKESTRMLKALGLPNIKIEKKHKYLLQSIIVTCFIYIFTFKHVSFDLLSYIVASVFIILIGTLLTQFPNIDYKNLPYIVLMPLSLLAGAILFMEYFPNLGVMVKYLAVVGFGFLYYLVSLVDNIYLVIEEREEIIPLYRAATTWSQILQVIVAIPLFSGIYKLDVIGVVQALLVGIVSFLFTLYQIWSSRFDKDAKNLRVGETVFLSGLVSFFVSSVAVAITFFPTEAFLRALLSSVVLMFGLSYVASHLRNSISKKMVSEFTLIFLIFFTILIIFNS